MFLVARADQAAADVLAAADPEPHQSLVYSPGSTTLGSQPAGGDWAGLGRDTAYLIGYQALAFAILYVAPESVSNWSEESKHNYDFNKWVENVTHPQVDSDEAYLNYVLHPYWGSAYFLDARGRGFGRWGSFLYSFFCSCLYEFGTEAFAEPVSVQDFFVTPIAARCSGSPRGRLEQPQGQGGVAELGRIGAPGAHRSIGADQQCRGRPLRVQETSARRPAAASDRAGARPRDLCRCPTEHAVVRRSPEYPVQVLKSYP